ncbi:hypothetical protein WOSG25_040680 [Weissella oryzae SG25]|uniref:Uncharacterized protein n=1 Tax=Weissella oryzae (strain DSM 25784 / JCM 18191 / LMG 30913 / SG25) TaxID=1329250 RepID=A0A069CTQ5_WEIOS|nr:hypothetical protein [Weissella oryzae]GAK30628.1 hypothetical protein WOSG25_040680 [Weissella oryzae SG25]
MKRLKEGFAWHFWIWLPVLAFVLPYLIDKTHLVSNNFKIIGLMFIINSIYSAYTGFYLRAHGAFWYLLVLWPLAIALATWLGLFVVLYGYFFALLYLVISIFTYTHGQTDDLDYSDQIPVDGGFKGDR